VQRVANRLKSQGYVKLEKRNSLALSEKGKKAAIQAQQNADIAGVQHG
jgi:Mn-dependent DtxR family transcriptional regulator